MQTEFQTLEYPDQTDATGVVWSGSTLFARPVCPKTLDHYGTTQFIRLIELRRHYANRTFYVFFVLRIISGPRVKFVQWMPLHPPVVYTTDSSNAVVPMLFLFCVAL